VTVLGPGINFETALAILPAGGSAAAQEGLTLIRWVCEDDWYFITMRVVVTLLIVLFDSLLTSSHHHSVCFQLEVRITKCTKCIVNRKAMAFSSIHILSYHITSYASIPKLSSVQLSNQTPSPRLAQVSNYPTRHLHPGSLNSK
jgi:hypothetical protein